MGVRCSARPLRRRGLVLVAALLTACGGSTDDGGPDATDALGDEGAVGVDSAEYAGVASIDRRPALLGELGQPDSFLITVDEIDGVNSRFESWMYYDAHTQIDFIDGELLWDIELEPLPDGSLLPLQYAPSEFTMLADIDTTLASLADVELIEIDATDTEVEGAEIWAGEQLVLGFVDGLLVYVETYPLAPGEQEVGS